MFGFDEGFVQYHSARTMFISDRVYKWIEKTEGKKQVLNMGSGVDTRAYWDQSLKGVSMYIEVDTKSVNDYKDKVLEEIKAKGELPELVCERQVVSIDFAKESTKDIANHGFDQTVPTCWILEGLVMYLDKDSVVKMYNEISDISPPGSLIMVNIMAGAPGASGDLADETFKARGWTKDDQVMFGDDGFNYGRYPEGKEPSKVVGFVIYHL